MLLLKRVRPNTLTPHAADKDAALTRLESSFLSLTLECPYMDDMTALIKRVERLHVNITNRYTPLPLYKQLGVIVRALENTGDRRFANVQRTWCEFRDVTGELITPSETQRLFLTSFLNANTQAIYGRDFEAAAERILRENNWEEFRQEVFVIAARADGKTFAVAMFIAATLIVCPGIRQAVFGHSQRGSNYVLALVAEMLQSHPLGQQLLVRATAEKILLRGPDGPLDTRVCLALPNNENTTRGTQVKMIFVDEMAFVSRDLLMGTLVPMLSKKETSIVGISTPLGDDNIYTWLTRLEDPNTEPRRSLFNVIRAGRTCPACIEKNRADECEHMLASGTPPWKSLKKVARMKAIYDDCPHLHIRENLGGVANSDKPAFRALDVDALFSNISRNIEKVKCVYVAVDPSGGGPSNFAAVAAVEDGHRLSVRVNT